jgi:tetratricopeptide (TPR) repeat protein
VDGLFLAAVAADPLDPTPCVERARWRLGLSAHAALRDQAFQAAADSVAQAVGRDPFSVGLRRMQMQLYQAKAQHTNRADDYHDAIAAARSALRLYPNDPNGYVSLAECQLAAGEAMRSDDLLRDAIASYTDALALDDARPEWERIRGFRDRKRQAIEAEIQRARSLLQMKP